MRKLLTSTLFTVALVALAPFASPAFAATQDVTITHPGSAAEFLALGRSFCKQHLGVINARTPGKLNPDFPAVPGAPERIPYTVTDIDGASSGRIQKCVSIIIQDFFESTSHTFDIGEATRSADLTVITPVRDRPDQTVVDSDID